MRDRNDDIEYKFYNKSLFLFDQEQAQEIIGLIQQLQECVAEILVSNRLAPFDNDDDLK